MALEQALEQTLQLEVRQRHLVGTTGRGLPPVVCAPVGSLEPELPLEGRQARRLLGDAERSRPAVREAH